MFKVVREVNPVEAATESYAEPTENTTENVEDAMDESMAMEAFAYSEELNDELLTALEAFGRGGNTVDKLSDKVRKKIFNTKRLKDLDKIDRAISKEVIAYNEAMSDMRNAANDYSVGKINKHVMKGKIQSAQNRLKRSLKILSLKSFGASKGEITSEDIKNLKQFIINVKMMVNERKIELQKETAPATEGKNCGTACEGENCEDGEVCDKKKKKCDDDDECDEDEDDVDDDDIDDSYADYIESIIASESTVEKPLTRAEFKLAINSEMAKNDPDIKTAIRSGSYTKSKLEKMGILRPAKEACGKKKKKDTSEIITSKDEKASKAVESFNNLLDNIINNYGNDYIEDDEDREPTRAEKAVESFNNLLDSIISRYGNDYEEPSKVELAVEAYDHLLDSIIEKYSGYEEDDEYDEAMESRGAKIETTWKIKNGLLRKEAAAQKKEASKLAHAKNYEEALRCLKGAKVSLNSLKDHINELSMAEYKDITPGKGESDEAFDNFVEKQLAWVNKELGKIDTYADKIREKNGKATESLELTEDDMLDIAVESILTALEADEEEEDEVDQAFESVLSLIDEIEAEEDIDAEEEALESALNGLNDVLDDDQDTTIAAAFESVLTQYTEALAADDEEALMNISLESLMDAMGIEAYADSEEDDEEEAEEDTEVEEEAEESDVEDDIEDVPDDYDEATESFLDLDIMNMDADLELELALMD